MTQKKPSPFAIGLKKVIQQKPISQKEFAEDITSQVNLSNILSGQTGTSENMRKKLADRAGMTVEEIIEFGTPKESQASEAQPKDPVLDKLDTSAKLHDEITCMNLPEVVNSILSANNTITAQLAEHLRSTTTTLSALAKDRDWILEQYHLEQTALNTVSESIKVIDRSKRILRCNNAQFGSTLQLTGEESCMEEGRELCKHNCLAQMVFLKKTIQRYVGKNNEGQWESRVAYPVLSRSGLVDKVVIVTSNLEDLISHCKDNEINLFED